MSTASADPGQPISWRVVSAETPVQATDGTVAGHVADVLGADAEDIFHGLVVKRAAGPECVVLAERITALLADRVETDLSTAEIAALPPYETEATFHLGVTGLIRKHEGWIKGG
ncbi:MAG TPA: hypothetical protein VFW92_05300 [Candidatus Limnocylindrales bacterium]|nr:hypothetical protein [Candidatus Limnocylindrales bacterium]